MAEDEYRGILRAQTSLAAPVANELRMLHRRRAAAGEQASAAAALRRAHQAQGLGTATYDDALEVALIRDYEGVRGVRAARRPPPRDAGRVPAAQEACTDAPGGAASSAEGASVGGADGEEAGKEASTDDALEGFENVDALDAAAVALKYLPEETDDSRALFVAIYEGTRPQAVPLPDVLSTYFLFKDTQDAAARAVAHLHAVGRLRELGFASPAIGAALLLYEGNEERTLEHLLKAA